MRARFVVASALIAVFVALGASIVGFNGGAGRGHEAAARVASPRLPGGDDSSVGQDDALVVLSTQDLASFYETMELVRTNGGEVPQAYAPNAFVATLNPEVELALRQHPAVARIERGVVDPASLTPLGGQAETAAYIWNTVFRGVPDPIAASAPSEPPPERQGPDFVIPPPEEPGVSTVPGAPSSTQTTEFMAGSVAYSVVFVESSGGSGNCSPADAQTENWDAGRRTTVLSEISAGLAFWTARSNRASPLSFVLDNWGTQPTSCEPITRTASGSTSDERKWVADVLTAMGYSATTGNYQSVARTFAAARRTALGTDWAYTIFVVDSLNDSDGKFSNGQFAYSYINGPFMVMTYDNDNWGIGLMNLVTAHETGHTFGALDEYAASGCSTSDTWGYLNVADASCNNGGITTDKSIMGEASEQQDASVDVSTSARGAIGWRNPGGSPLVVDVVRTATVSLTAYTPDPTSDNTPTYSATAGNTPYPPGGCNTVGGTCYRWPSAVTVSRVAAAQWNLDGGAFTSSGVVPTDGAFDEESDAYTFTPASPVANGLHTFGTRSTNNFGHVSSTATDVLTISGGAITPTPTNTPGTPTPGECRTYTSTDVPKAISDLSTVTSTVSVGDRFTLAHVNVGPLNITHTWDSDLDVFLISPQGTRVELFTDVGSNGDNFTNTVLDDECATPIGSGAAPFTGCYQPEGSLADFDGESSSVLESPPNGIWTLEITDDLGGDSGTLNSWQLELCGSATLTPTPTPTGSVTITPTPTYTPTPGTPTPGNAMAVDAVSGGGVDVTRTVSGTFDIDIDITSAPTPYQGYQVGLKYDDGVLEFVPTDDLNDDTINESWHYTGLGGMLLVSPTTPGDLDGDTVPDTQFGGATRNSGTTTATGAVITARFQCKPGVVGPSPLHLVTEQDPGALFTSTLLPGGPVILTLLTDAVVNCACIDRLGDTACDDPVNDPDDDGCTAAEEAALGSVFDPTAAGWYDVYDVPVPAKPDTGPGSGANGKRDKVVDIRDVLAVLFYAFTQPTGACGDNANVNGVDYDCVKGVDLNGDSTDDAGTSHNIKEGLKYDRSAGLGPDPVTGIDPAGPPDNVVDIRDVLATLAQAFLVDCSGP